MSEWKATVIIHRWFVSCLQEFQLVEFLPNHTAVCKSAQLTTRCGMCEMRGLKLSCHTQNQSCHYGATSQSTALRKYTVHITHSLAKSPWHMKVVTLSCWCITFTWVSLMFRKDTTLWVTRVTRVVIFAIAYYSLVRGQGLRHYIFLPLSENPMKRPKM